MSSKVQIAIKASRFRELQNHSERLGVPIEELVDEALTEFIEAHAARKAG